MSKKIFHERKDCPICGNTRNRELLSRRFDHPSVHGFLSKYYKDAKYIKELDSYDFTVLECPRCSFIWQKFILDDKHMFELYEKLISGAESLEKKKKASFLFFESYAREMRFISRYLKKSPYLVSVLDYGMGWGYWSLMAKAFGFKVHGVEISDSRIKFAKENGLNVIKSDEKIQDKKFDFINIYHVLEHVDDPVRMTTTLRRMLGPDGIFRIVVPNGVGIRRHLLSKSWSASKDAIHPLEHINCFTRKSLLFLARKSGLVPAPFVWELGSLFLTHPFELLKDLYRRIFGTEIYLKIKDK